MSYQERIYRNDMHSDRFCYFSIVQEETDLRVAIGRGEWNDEIPERLSELITTLRQNIKNKITSDPAFMYSHKPIKGSGNNPKVIKDMLESSARAGVGPMGAVAGAVAESAGEIICSEFGLQNIMIENGGDIWLKISEPVTIRIDAGTSSLSSLSGIEITPEQTPCGVCTSSGSIGHSFSYGKADAVVVVSPSAALADAWATSLCNRIMSETDLEKTVSLTLREPGIQGVVAIKNNAIAISGNIVLKKIHL